MKKYTALIVTLLCVLLAFPFVSAAVSVANVDLDVNQAVERSNPIPERSDSALDDTDELSYVTFSIPVTASGQTETVTSVTPNLNGFVYDSFANSLNSSSRYIVDTSLPLTVAAGTTQNIAVRVLVPSNLDAVDSNYNRVKHTITASVVTSAGTQTPSLSFYVENNLNIKKVRIVQGDDTYKCDVDEDSTGLDCDDDIDQLQVGQSFDLEFTLENNFNEDSELDFSGIDMNLDSDNSDIDPSDDSFDEDVNADDEQVFTVSFDVDDSVEDGDDAKITIEADIDDDNGAQHGFSHDFTIEFNTNDYDIATPTLMVSPNAVCPADTVVVTYTLENLGSKKQSNVRPVLINDALALNKVLPTASLDSEGDRDDSFRGTYSLSIPAKARAGSYPLQLHVYYRDEDSSDALQMTTTTLTVQNCANGVPVETTSSSSNSQSGSTESNTAGQTNGGVVVVQPGQSGTGATNGGSTGASSVPVRAVVADNSDTPYLIGLGVGLLVLLVVVGLLISAITRK